MLTPAVWNISSPLLGLPKVFSRNMMYNKILISLRFNWETTKELATYLFSEYRN